MECLCDLVQKGHWLQGNSKLQWPTGDPTPKKHSEPLQLHSVDNRGQVDVMSAPNIYELAPLLTRDKTIPFKRCPECLIDSAAAKLLGTPPRHRTPTAPLFSTSPNPWSQEGCSAPATRFNCASAVSCAAASASEI
ncbi:hypothetical protein PAHAL_1G314300 [Panicum hallii]|uniref:Uncharacterized protein n=1 Tax=Panicum hallii TaxID=206008 RepID=A0A2S3GRK7_9POAL|nr:hypothetical protein PAHAL_1G314300 [Panicum hallii]